MPKLTTVVSVSSRAAVARRPRAFVRVAGPDAESYLQRMVSNDVSALAAGDACDALLLTAKARVIAPLRVLRRGADDFLLLTEPELGERVRGELVRFRLAARAEIEVETDDSYVLLGEEPQIPADALAIPTDDYGVRGWELIGGPREATIDDEELERLRIEAGTPRFGREIDDRVLPAEAGLTERAVSFTKGCYPGQEPIARLHYRGHANRVLRVLELDVDEPPPYDAELSYEGKAVGRITSAARRRDGTVVALGYVRTSVPVDATLDLAGSGTARPLDFAPPRP